MLQTSHAQPRKRNESYSDPETPDRGDDEQDIARRVQPSNAIHRFEVALHRDHQQVARTERRDHPCTKPLRPERHRAHEAGSREQNVHEQSPLSPPRPTGRPLKCSSCRKNAPNAQQGETGGPKICRPHRGDDTRSVVAPRRSSPRCKGLQIPQLQPPQLHQRQGWSTVAIRRS